MERHTFRRLHANDFGASDKILVLLAEYSTLRDEILQRNTVLNQIFVLTGSASVAFIVFAFDHSAIWGAFLMVLLPALTLIGFRIIEYDTLVAAARIRQLEHALNRCAGEKLMVWETDRGLTNVGYGQRFKYAARVFAPIGRLLSAGANYFFGLPKLLATVMFRPFRASH